MRLTIYSSKGGVGKTPISVLFAVDKGFAVGSNESSKKRDMYVEHMPEDMYLKNPMDEPFPLIPDGIDIVFDMAGHMTKYDHALVSAIKQSDVVIVPMWNNENALNYGKDTLEEIQSIAKRVIVVATRLKRKKKESYLPWEEVADFKAVVNATAEIDSGLVVLPLKYSDVYDTICKNFTSFHKMADSSKLFASGQKEMLAQIDNIYKEVGCHV
ncbi:MAG: hypothetical protein ACI88H_001981 [Cocleimonas sp.]|jgi:hypothetical protein